MTPATLPGGLPAPLAVLLVALALGGFSWLLWWLSEPARWLDLLTRAGALQVWDGKIIEPEERRECFLCGGPMLRRIPNPAVDRIEWEDCLGCGRFSRGRPIRGDHA